jgi:uncharacterized protein
MSAENIKLIQDAYARFQRADLPGLLDICCDDVTWGMIGREHDVPMAGIRTGKNGVVEFFTRLKATQQLLDFAPRKFVADDDTVCCIGHTKWKMHQSHGL